MRKRTEYAIVRRAFSYSAPLGGLARIRARARALARTRHAVYKYHRPSKQTSSAKKASGMARNRTKFKYAFALRCGVRYRRFADMSLGPANSSHPVIKAAYWRGIVAALDALYLSETEFCRQLAREGSQEDYADAQFIIRSLRRAVRACRRDIETTRRENDYVSSAKLALVEQELTYLANLGQPPEEVPAYGSRTGTKAYEDGVDRNEVGPYNRSSDLRDEDQPSGAGEQEDQGGESESED